MCISAGGVASVQSLKGSETMLGASPLKTTMALATSGLDHLQLAIKCVYLCRDVEDTSVHFMVVSNFGGQSPVVCALGQLNGLMIGRRLPGDGVNEPYWEWLSGGALDIGRGGE